ncbi:MAG TPA: RDD family protein [Bryobacteraceae bacterium]|nr:RDD family protein [Bryobacteraceae bacterium]
MSPADPETLSCAECQRPYGADDLARFGTVLICSDCKNRYVQKLREGVAPGAPAPYAGFWVRFVAWLIDGIILMVAGSIVQFALLGSMTSLRQPSPGAGVPEALGGAMLAMLGAVFLVDMVIGCSYEAFFVSSSLCATPGKLALELKVLRPNGARLGLGRAVGRYFAKRLNTMTAGVGYVMAAFDSEKRGLHDLICDTRVVRRRA